jgi:hypothetical protein
MARYVITHKQTDSRNYQTETRDLGDGRHVKESTVQSHGSPRVYESDNGQTSQGKLSVGDAGPMSSGEYHGTPQLVDIDDDILICKV